MANMLPLIMLRPKADIFNQSQSLCCPQIQLEMLPQHNALGSHYNLGVVYEMKSLCFL